MSRQILVTGGAGFLGSHLVDLLLKDGHNVTAVDNGITGSWANLAHHEGNKNLEMIDADVSLELPDFGQLDQIFHFASPASPKDFEPLALEILAVNSKGTENCLKLAERTGATFIFASTSEVYGDPLVSPQPESYWGNVNPIGVRSVYDESKRFGEALTMAYHRGKGVQTRIIRYFNTYGPRMRIDDGRVVSNMIVQALKNQPLTVYGDGSQTRSFGYCHDSARGAILLANSSYHLPVNIGTTFEMPVVDLAKLIIRLTKSSSGVEYLPAAPDDPKRRRPDLSTANRELGYEPTIGLEEGLLETIEHFRKAV
jgi:dTDP-glucose 4,6-dehydratase